MSFLASFVLVRYKLSEAKKEEAKVEHFTGSRTVASPISTHSHHDLEKIGARSHSRSSNPHAPEPMRDSTTGEPIWSCNPRLEQVYRRPFSRQPPTGLLSRCHALCISLATIGFVLALMGTLCYAWAVQPRSVAVFASAMMGLCLVSGVGILVW